MPNPGADAPLRKVTLNLYEADCLALEQSLGHGWTAKVRDLTHNYVVTYTDRDAYAKIKRTLGDLG